MSQIPETSCSGHGRPLLGTCFCDVGWSGNKRFEQWDQIPSCGAYNDKCFFHPDYGVAKVSKERWQGAQKAENNTWLEQRTSDRNEEHARNFNNYAALTMYVSYNFQKNGFKT
ncbi:hypothetical protein Naga_100748g4 [Nannochloropsis gaditana]|uniref:Uncharacterized protein n=1 Tax=Nannochloropsis gaditana TaxID=72520 RepID=W7T0F2_9STRA|nr:hypothetical protein Naga_100748g4 [Nannochloropsis gaditana]